MRTIDTLHIHASPDEVFRHAADVESWPRILPHYRWVKRETGARAGDGIVEMAAWRPFGPLRWPTWWKSRMGVDPQLRQITYRHIGGITTGMDVLWRIDPTPEGWSDVSIVHEWSGPRWPLGAAIARWVIGPVFVSGIARRTLAGVAKAAEGTGHSAQRLANSAQGTARRAQQPGAES